MGLKDIFRSVPTVSAEEIKRAVDSPEGPLLLDVREPSEYESGHIPGARHIPLSRLADGAGGLDPTEPVVTYCKAGKRSRSAASILLGLGFRSVLSMDGGIDAWRGLQATGTYDHGLSIVAEGLSPEETLGLALAFEEGSGKFYGALEKLFPGTESAETFAALLHAEEAHARGITDAAAGMGISLRKVKAGEGLMEGAVRIDEALAWCREPGRGAFDVLELAMQVEANALDLYLKMLGRQDLSPAHGALEGIVADEKAHLRRLGALLEKSA